MQISPETINTVITVIVSAAVVVTGVATSLKKLGLLHFGKKEVELIEDRRFMNPCSLHVEVSTLLKKINETQIKNIEKHLQHEHALEVGEEKFEHLRTDIGDLKEGMAVLMDRSGGIPPKLKNKKWI